MKEHREKQRQPKESKISTFPATTEELIALIGKTAIIIVFLGYLYGFVITWSAYGTIGIPPYWYPVFLFMPPGICYLMIIVIFLSLGIKLGGEETKPFSLRSLVQTLNFAVPFSIAFLIVGGLLFDEKSYYAHWDIMIKKQTLFVLSVFALGFIQMVGSGFRRSGLENVARIIDIVFLALVIVFHWWNHTTSMIIFFMVCILIVVMSEMFFTRDISDITLNIPVGDRLRNLRYLVPFVIFSIFPATFFGRALYFTLRPAFGGGNYKTCRVIMNTQNAAFEKVVSETRQLMNKGDQIKDIEAGRIDCSLLGKDNDLYFVRINIGEEDHKVLALHRDLVQSIIFGYIAKQPRNVDSLVPTENVSGKDTTNNSRIIEKED